MPKAVVVIKSDTAFETLKELLSQAEIDEIVHLHNGIEARMYFVSGKKAELAVISVPLEDETGTELACEINEKYFSAVIAIAGAEIIKNVQKKIASCGGVAVLRQSVRASVAQAASSAVAINSELMRVRLENAELKRRMDDIKLVDRAKCVLIHYLRISEPEAHKLIQKQAMDRRLNVTDVAKNILNTYEE